MSQVEVKGNMQISTCHGSIKPITRCGAIVILIINILLPGIGTIIYGCCYLDQTLRKGYILTGFLQLLFAACLVGWIWSIYTGCKICDAAKTSNQLSNIMKDLERHGSNQK